MGWGGLDLEKDGFKIRRDFIWVHSSELFIRFMKELDM